MRIEGSSSPARSLTVRDFVAEDAKRWDAFVHDAPGGTFFHRSQWKEIIERGLGHRCHYLYAEEQGDIVGVLPLAEIRSRLFGHALISTPFCVYGGIVASEGHVYTRLRAEAVALAKRFNVDYLELRSREPDGSTWPHKDLYVTFRKRLSDDHEINFKEIPRKQRAVIRKGRDAGLTVDAFPDLDKFYAVYSESVRNLGTPVLSKRYYALVQDMFGKDCEIMVINHCRRPVAAVMSFYFRDEVHPYYGGGTWRARELKANDFMYWAVMQRAVERGMHLFDFGRSKRDTGSYHFKRHWGFEPQTLSYSYHLEEATAVPNVSPTNKKYGIFIRAWRHMPLPASRVLGPWIARELG